MARIIKSEWRVIKEDKPIAGDEIYRVYRILDLSKPDEIGNREYRPELHVEKESAEFVAQQLNSRK